MSLIRSTEEKLSGGADGATCYVRGGGHVAAAVAERLPTEDRPVSVGGESYESPGPAGLRGDPTDVRVLEAAGVTDASTVAVLANVPEWLEPLTEAGHEPICVTSALADVPTENV